MSEVLEHDHEDVRLLMIEGVSKYNPFSFSLNKAIQEAFIKAANDQHIRAIILTSGSGASLSVGADFNELKNFSTNEEVYNWIDEVVSLYTAILTIEKPTIVAFDGYAIGMGFQLSMMFDYRIMTEKSEFGMPELQHGIACTLGATILEHVVGYNIMKEIVLGCNPIKSKYALQTNLVNQVVKSEKLISEALYIGKKFATYQDTPFSSTKRVMVKNLLKAIIEVTEETKIIHSKCFSIKSADKHFKNILKQKY